MTIRCHTCHQKPSSVCLKCYTERKNAYARPLVRLKRDWEALLKSVDHLAWQRSFAVYQQDRDVLLLKINKEKQRILQLRKSSHLAKTSTAMDTFPKMKSDTIDLETQLEQTTEAIGEHQEMLLPSFQAALDNYANCRNAQVFAIVYGGIPCPTTISLFQLPLDDFHSVIGHMAWTLTLYERLFQISIKFDYVNRNSHSIVRLHKPFTSLPSTLHRYSYPLYIIPSEDITIEEVRSFILGVSFLFYDMSCLYGDGSVPSIECLLEWPAMGSPLPFVQVIEHVVKEMIQVPHFSNVLQAILKPSGYHVIDETSSRSSRVSVDEFEMVSHQVDTPLEMAEVWPDLFDMLSLAQYE